MLECGEAVALLVGGEEQFNGKLPSLNPFPILELPCLSFGLMDRQISFAIMSVAVYSSRIEIYPPAPECIKVPNMPQVKSSHCLLM